jgi:hypothetical protein
MTQIATDIDEFWEELLACLEEKRVVPIIGGNVLELEGEHAGKTLYRLLAEKLAERVKVDLAALPPAYTLNDVVCEHIRNRGRREEVYAKIRAIAKELPLKPPAALLKLARVEAFDLFVTLTFDTLLVEAINQERFGGAPRTEHAAYAPNKVQDLPAARAQLSAPVVYSLFGKLSVAPDYVITEEDTLEFLCALQSDTKRPNLLFDELQGSNLLFIGCPFPDWLARFFIRIAKNRKLSAQRGETEILVDQLHAGDRNLVLFLESFSYGTRIASVSPAQFISELERRWLERHPRSAAGAAQPEAAGAAASVPDMQSGAIFLSYAKEDLASVQSLQRSLEAQGIDVWFDKDRLEAGDQYDQKIKRHIKTCSLFMPVISQNTERRLEGYFRREWRLAEERSMGIADNVPFILPVVVDDTPEYSETVPEAFKRAQWTRLRQGAVTPEFEARIVKLVREFRKRERGLA